MKIRRAFAALTVAAALLSAAVVAPARTARADVLHFFRQYENLYSRKCLDLEQWTDDDGLPAVQRDCLPDHLYYFNASTRQWFRDYPVDERADQLLFHEPWDGWKCLDVAGFDTDDSALITQHDCNGGPHQNWRLLPRPSFEGRGLEGLYSGSYLIQNEYTGKCLTLAAAQTYNDVAVVQRPCYTAGTLQLWLPHSEAY